MTVDRTRILVLNYNGGALLRECLPSIIEASARSPVPCAVSVVDNGSTDDSIDCLTRWPTVGVIAQPNRGLASFNRVLEHLDEPAVLLLNNDVKLDPNALGPLIRELERHPGALFTAPKCWAFDGSTYEGMRTRVRFRFGLVQGMSRVPGHESCIDRPDLTAAAGPVLMVDRRKFLALGGYDPIYFPGRIEDLDLGFRGWMRGWPGLYVPESVAFHKGFGSFADAFGADGCDRLAIRNSLIFAWKNLRGRRLLAHVAWLPVRLSRSLALGRLGFARSFADALARLSNVLESRRAQSPRHAELVQRQEAYFHQFRW